MIKSLLASVLLAVFGTVAEQYDGESGKRKQRRQARTANSAPSA